MLIIFLLTIYGIGSEALFSKSMDDDNFGKYLAALGTYGDFVGGLTNPIIGSIGFFALMITITLQIRQNKRSSEQSYEASIFNLINLQNNIIENIDYSGHVKRSSFAKFLEDHTSSFNAIGVIILPVKIYSSACYFYKIFNSNYNEYFGHYFRNLYTILKTIDNLPESFDRKKYYARILRAQLSMSELTILFLNCLPGVCDKGEYAELLIKYQMLEHLKISALTEQKPVKHSYITDTYYTIGDKVSVSIYEVAFYMYGFSKNQSHNYSIKKFGFGAFGKNISTALKKIDAAVKTEQSGSIVVYDKKSESDFKEKCNFKLSLFRRKFWKRKGDFDFDMEE
ncbi:putative phage abortive infection protein [Pantoea agglomerans]|uniref:putative phage abortive infection protein n=2 Tax=Bacteria TaxID=2 RepID=UPI00320835C4